jgi:hypothetical protein
MQSNGNDGEDLSITTLNNMSMTQKLIDRGFKGYEKWYTNEPEELPYHPKDIQMKFWRQYFCFEHWMLHSPYISTSFILRAHHKNFGYYHLFTDANGDVIDDVLGWGNPLFLALPDDKKLYRSEGKALLLTALSEESREMVMTLFSVSRRLMLIEQAYLHCREWFQLHPLWYQDYPQSLITQGSIQQQNWFRDHADWYEGYPKQIPFKNYDVSLSFDRQGICFRHATILYPFLFTQLKVYAGGYEIGSYCLVARLNGLVVKEMSGILPFPFDPTP